MSFCHFWPITDRSESCQCFTDTKMTCGWCVVNRVQQSLSQILALTKYGGLDDSC
ncbi:hypothetical protein T11_1494 [Trichinella zimbabwensis]|uniref:Uncharacterized protein n=1 Tax=Trichinella zimbabwensis TaxID=268475 RepID=A0A0V1GB63_9BILA|nr:hypothetical protein T11_1494 [Trichinella zimbabwensis]